MVGKKEEGEEKEMEVVETLSNEHLSLISKIEPLMEKFSME